MSVALHRLPWFGRRVTQSPGLVAARVVSIAALLMATLVSPSYGGTRRHDRDDQLYLDLAAEAVFDPVGKFNWDEPGVSYLASGTLIRDDWVLTAGHVVGGTDDLGGGVSNMRFTLGGTIYTADQWIPHPQWAASGGADNLTAGWDIGLVHLSTTVSGVAPAELYDLDDGSELGLVGTQVGFGATGTGSTGYQSNTTGTKRAGDNILDVVGTAETSGTPNNIFSHDRLIAVDFDNPGGGFGNNPYGSGTPLDLEYLVAPGDSGGGLFLDVGGQMKLAGVTSYISSFDLNGANSDYGDRAAFTRVSQFLDWIDDLVGEDEPIVLPGDYNLDGVVDAVDYTIWRDTLGSTNDLRANGDDTGASLGLIDLADYFVWKNNFGASLGSGTGTSSAVVPEPASLLLWLCGGWIVLVIKRG